MLPKNPSDYRSLLWVLIAAGLVAAQVARPAWIPYLAWLSAYFALACGTIAHNHNHCPTFRDRRANQVFGCVLAVFYGYPTFAWIPTHNLNHHKYVNRPGDATITWRRTNRHTLFTAIQYVIISASHQNLLMDAYVKKARSENPALYRRIITQYVVWIGAHICVFAAAVAVHDWMVGLYVWAASMAIPSVYGLWSVMLFNYDQHVHTDADHPYNHSRSFKGRILNFLLFNNGFHYVHHEHPGTHWSKLPALHREVEGLIHPSLNLRSAWWYWITAYWLTPFFPQLGTVQLGRDPTQAARIAETTVGEVSLGEPGSNNERLPSVAPGGLPDAAESRGQPKEVAPGADALGAHHT